MNLLLSSLQSVAMVLLAGGVLVFFVPEGKLGKSMRFLLSLFLLFSLLAPFRQMEWSWDLFSGFAQTASEETISAQEQMQTAFTGLYETAMQEELQQTLRQQGIDVKAWVTVHNSEKGSIEIEQIQIEIEDGTPSSTVITLVEELYGQTPIIVS